MSRTDVIRAPSRRQSISRGKKVVADLAETDVAVNGEFEQADEDL